MDSPPHIFSLLLFTPLKGDLSSKSPIMVARMEKICIGNSMICSDIRRKYHE